MTDLHEEYVNYKKTMGNKVIDAAIHPSATWGDGTTIWHYARILAGVRIGTNCSIGGGTEIGRDSVIGDNTRIGANAFLPPNSVVGRNVFIGPGVVCTDDKTPHIHEPGEAPYTPHPPHIEDYAAIGAGAVLCPGVRIGKYARVAAGAIVTKDVVERGMVRCQPARPRTPPVEWENWAKEHVAEAASNIVS